MEDDYTLTPEEMPQVGDKYRMFGRFLIHVRGIVDDQVVYRQWSQRKGWQYACEPLWFFKSSMGFVKKEK